jgi:UDP:flavonoid glycosyltransferase YjiC (YdhE family)
MRILFTSLRNASHLQPLVPLIEASLRLGHEPAVSAAIEVREAVLATGAAFFPFAHPATDRLVPLWQRAQNLGGEDANRFVLSEIFAGIDAECALPDLIATLERFRPALVVRASQEYAALLAGEKLGIPVARCSSGLSRLEQHFGELTAAPLDQHRASLGLALDPAGERVKNELMLSALPRSFEDPKYLGPETIRRFRLLRPAAPPLPAWWRPPERPFVYATLGTVAGMMENLRALYRMLIDALADLPVHALLTTGPALAPESLGQAPPNVHVERFVAQDRVLPHAAAALCHGGVGSVLGALSAGVPLVVMPLFADQPANSERVAELGVGFGLKQGSANVELFRDAIMRLLGEPSFRHAATALSREIAELPTADEVLESLVSGR